MIIHSAVIPEMSHGGGAGEGYLAAEGCGPDLRPTRARWVDIPGHWVLSLFLIYFLLWLL